MLVYHRRLFFLQDELDFAVPTDGGPPSSAPAGEVSTLTYVDKP